MPPSSSSSSRNVREGESWESGMMIKTERKRFVNKIKVHYNPLWFLSPLFSQLIQDMALWMCVLSTWLTHLIQCSLRILSRFCVWPHISRHFYGAICRRLKGICFLCGSSHKIPSSLSLCLCCSLVPTLCHSTHNFSVILSALANVYAQ